MAKRHAIDVLKSAADKLVKLLEAESHAEAYAAHGEIGEAIQRIERALKAANSVKLDVTRFADPDVIELFRALKDVEGGSG